MRILLPIINFGRSGGYRVLSELGNNLIKKGHEVIFISSSVNGFIQPYFPTNSKIVFVDTNGNIIDNTKDHKDAIYDNKASVLTRFRQLNSLRKALNKFSTHEDIIIASYSLTAFVVYFSKENLNKYYYIQAYEPEYFSKSAFGKLASKITSLSYGLRLKRIVNSPVYYNYKNLEARLLVYPGIDFNIFNPSLKVYKKDFENTPIVIGCIGRIEEVKGTSLVINAFHELRKSQINCELHVAVFGNESMIDDTIQGIYPKNDFELAEFYRGVDVLVAPMTGQYGAVHYPVVEAMACGTAVITTAFHPAHPDNAWLCIPHSSKSIADQIINIRSNPDMYREKSLRGNKDIQHLAWEKVTGNLITILEEKC